MDFLPVAGKSPSPQRTLRSFRLQGRRFPAVGKMYPPRLRFRDKTANQWVSMTHHRHCGRSPAAIVSKKNAESVGTSISHFALDILAPRMLLLYQVPRVKYRRFGSRGCGAERPGYALPKERRVSSYGLLPLHVLLFRRKKGRRNGLDPIGEHVEHNSDRSPDTASAASGAGSRAVPVHPLLSGQMANRPPNEEGTGKPHAQEGVHARLTIASKICVPVTR
jgi:hypothetical protein